MAGLLFAFDSSELLTLLSTYQRRTHANNTLLWPDGSFQGDRHPLLANHLRRTSKALARPHADRLQTSLHRGRCGANQELLCRNDEGERDKKERPGVMQRQGVKDERRTPMYDSNSDSDFSQADFELLPHERISEV